MTKSKNKMHGLSPAAAAAVATAVGAAMAKIASAKQKKGTATPSKNKKKKTKSKASALNLKPGKAGDRITPSAPGVVLRNSLVEKTRVRLPFDNTALSVWINSTATDITFNSATSGYRGVVFDPNAANSFFWPSAQSVNPINNAANTFRRWRIVNLRVQWISALSTNLGQLICFASTPDGGANPSALPVATAIQAIPGSVTFNAMTPRVDIPVQYNRDWMWSTDATAQTTGANRAEDAGVLFAEYVGALNISANNILGMLRVSGVLEFEEIGSQLGTLLNMSSSSPAPAAGPALPAPEAPNAASAASMVPYLPQQAASQGGLETPHLVTQPTSGLSTPAQAGSWFPGGQRR